MDNQHFIKKMGTFKCYVTPFSWKMDPYPPHRYTNNVKLYTLVMFPGKLTPPPQLRYVTLERPAYTYLKNHRILCC